MVKPELVQASAPAGSGNELQTPTGEILTEVSHQIGETLVAQFVEIDEHEPLTSEERSKVLTDSWWEGTKIAGEVEGSLYEVFKISTERADGQALDILNCSSTPLSLQDREALLATVSRVSEFTKGKIFDRVKGIVFSAGDKFEDRNLGGYVPSGGYLRLNIDEVRKEEGDELAPRYRRYFKEQPDIGTFEINLAHELGHAMDVQTYHETTASGLDIEAIWHPGVGGSMHNVSAFHRNVGWRHEIQDHASGLMGRIDIWSIDDAMMSERGEYPPTAYAASEPSEDFAESFAIAALGGDLSTLTTRSQILAKTIAAANGRTLSTAITLKQLAGQKSGDIKKTVTNQSF